MLKQFKFKQIMIAGAMLAVTGLAQAKDDAHYLDFNQAVQSAVADGAIDGSVKFYLAGTKSGGKVISKDLISNKKLMVLVNLLRQRVIGHCVQH